MEAEEQVERDAKLLKREMRMRGHVVRDFTRSSSRHACSSVKHLVKTVQLQLKVSDKICSEVWHAYCLHTKGFCIARGSKILLEVALRSG